MKKARIPGTRGRSLLVLPEIRDEWDSELKNAVAARNACTTEGSCPICGATGVTTEDAEFLGIFHITFEHEDDCPVWKLS